ncbi:heat shock protein 30 [Piedraia hortae CBS 480.64]|uniref:Heat shock protein 30 n=1 Tax=Piedraia hortae CBS 480.64 TaxID=1314780 RepID=A0A6A7BSK1_9PEZI|nr:heat shock protein 30 [Piedraia hortae CBS 480.64]
MSLYQNDFVPMFRFLDDYANHVASSSGKRGSPAKGLGSFQPKFDIQETKDSYKLYGEFPGMSQKDIQIEFTDPQRISITGRSECTYEEGDQSAGYINGNGKRKQPEHQPTVEDEEAASSTEVVQRQPHQKSSKPHTKLWLSERSFGQFSRTFEFPSQVNHDNVKASLKNGILAIVVPKAEQLKKRIDIE